MTISTFSRPVVKSLRTDLDAALASVAAKHGIQIDLGSMRFDSSEVRVTLTANTKPASSGLTQTAVPTKINFDEVVLGNVLPAELQGKKFRAGGSTFTLTGVKSCRKKYPFQGTGVRGGRYKFTKEQVKNGLV